MHPAQPAIALAAALLLCLASVIPSFAGDVPAMTFGLHTQDRIVALTFDDGPSPYTPAILNTLHRYGDHATFFEVGSQVQRYPQFSREVLSVGDEIANHSYSHPDLLYLSNGSIWSQLAQTQNAIHAATGITPVWFRPPDGAIDTRVVDVAWSLRLRTVLWSVDPQDWARPGIGVIVMRVLAAALPGSVILLHDGGGDRSETLDALPAILGSFQREGYRVVTVSDLFRWPGVKSARPHRDVEKRDISPMPHNRGTPIP